MSDQKSHEERLLEQALTEKLGGVRPPDQAKKILAAAEANKVSLATKPIRGPLWRQAARYSIAICLLLLFGGLVVISLQPQSVQHAVSWVNGVSPALPDSDPPLCPRFLRSQSCGNLGNTMGLS